MDNQIFPSNVEMEKQILSALLIRNGESVPKINAILSAEDFFRPEHKIIFNTILKLYAEGTPPNVLSIFEELHKAGKIEDVGLETIFAIPEMTFTNAYAEYHAKVVKEKSDLRKLIQMSEKIIEYAQRGEKSVNEILAVAEQNFTKLNSIGQTKPVGIAEYTETIQDTIEKMKVYANRKTGFTNIDEKEFFSPGLYVIGATPAAGKTTFCWQLLEQLSEQGETCIYCSYEMGLLELFTKSYARQLFIRNKQTTITAADIRRGATTLQLYNVFAEYVKSKNNLKVFKLRRESIDELLILLKPFCTNKEKAPIICLDYLQIIPTDKENIKSGIDDIVGKLKNFQDTTNTTFIVISSFNRSNYNQPVAFESFKESGNIEYSADTVWGLHLITPNNYADRNSIERAKKQQPRRIQLKCLKNRQGNNYDCYFKYYSAHDYFEPCDENDFENDDYSEPADI